MSDFYGLAKFQPGYVVQIATTRALHEFARTWKYHHPIQENQIRYGGHTARVRRSFMYHGGDILYELEDIPGLWHQELLTIPSGNRDTVPGDA